MMNPEMMRVAQEQMSRMSPADLAAMQQQLMSNPSLLKFASESIKNLSADDIRRAAEQLNQTKPEEMLDMSRKLAGANPEELAAMKLQAEQRMAYVVSNAKTLKNQGNDLFKLDRHADAAAKYRLARDNLKSVPSRDALSLQKVCSVNLMACYLKIGRFRECVDEGSEVLGYDPSNVKAYYRRGQAYKELGKLEAAVADLRKANELSPEEDAIADVLRDAEEKLAVEGEHPRGVVIEEIVEEEEEEGSELLPRSETSSSSASGHSVSQPSPPEASPSPSPSPAAADVQETMMNSMRDPAMGKLFTSMVQNMDPEMMSNIGRQFGMKLSRDDAARVQDAINALSPEALERVMRRMNRARRAVEAARKAKEFLLGRRGLVLAIVMLILAFIFHQLGFIGG